MLSVGSWFRIKLFVVWGLKICQNALKFRLFAVFSQYIYFHLAFSPKLLISLSVLGDEFLQPTTVNLPYSPNMQSFIRHCLLYSSYVALFYRKRLPQQNGDRRKRNLHAFWLYVGQGRVLAPPLPPTRDKRAGLVYYDCPPPPHSTPPWTKISDFREEQLKSRTASF